MKKMLSFLLLFSFPGLIFGQNSKERAFNGMTQQNLQSFAYYSPQLHSAVKALLQVPDCRNLLEQIQQDGPIGLRWEHLGSGHSDAAWYGDQRMIAVNSSKKHSDGQKICSILFEMHNAVSNSKFLKVDQLALNGMIDKDTYVESIEKLEHQNALNTKIMIEKGISLGVFPSDTRWPIIHNFNDHYKVQQLMGHSAQIASAYDMLNRDSKKPPYLGTIANLRNFSEQDRKKMLHLLVLKDSLEFGNSFEKEQARRVLHQTYQEIKFKPHSYKGQESNQMVVLNDVFRGNATFEKMRRTL